MAPPRLLAPLLGLLVLVAPAPSLGKVIYVTYAADNSEGNCPGQTCNMRAAWAAADLNDTIMLEVNPIMSSSLGPLRSAPGWGKTGYNGTVTITGPKDGAVVRGGNKFIAFDEFPFTWGKGTYSAQWQVVRLVLRNIEFTGFYYTSVANEYTSGVVVCLSDQVGWCNPHEGLDASPKKHTLKGDQEPHRMEGKGREALGFEDTVFGNWSLLRQHAMLEIDNCIFSNNSYYSVSMANSYGSIVSNHKSGQGVRPIIMTNTQFKNNTILGVSSAVGTAYGTTGGGCDALMISNCRFTGNNDITESTGGLIAGYDGPTIGSIGPVSISGSSFVGNKLGSTRGVISNGFNWHNHVYIYDTTIIDNVGNDQPPRDNAAAVIGSWIVMEKVTIVLPPSVPVRATNSMNDQYMSECDIVSTTGMAAQFTGFQVFNRNPIQTNVNGTGATTFADCAQAAPWLPCPKVQGAECMDAVNRDNVVIGYNCPQ